MDMTSRLLPAKRDEKLSKPPACVDLTNVHQLSLFQLRQELTARGKWDFKDDEISYQNALAKMVQVLLAERDQVVQQRATDLETAAFGGSKESLAMR